MIKLLTLIFVLIGLTVNANIYYVAPSNATPAGKDSNVGFITSPFFTLTKAWSVVRAGDTIYMRGGTYAYTTDQQLYNKNGTSSQTIKVWAYPGEIPRITDASGYVGQDLIYFEGNYIHFRGIEISNFNPQDFGWYSFRSQAANNCIFELLNIHHNRSALAIRGTSNNNLVLNSDFHHNADPEDGYGGADGMNISYITLTSATNTVRGCRAWYNSDDGFDTWSNEGFVLFENNWSWNNGYIEGTFNAAGDGSGFKLGEASDAQNVLKRTLRNNIAYQNRKWGFVENHAIVTMQLYNNTSIANGNWQYWFGDWGPSLIIAKNNISNGTNVFNSQSTQQNNSWQGKTVTNADFKSMDATQLLRPRKADGSLPDIDFLQLAAGSDLIDAGQNIGLPFKGSAPDMGAFESGGVVVPPPNQIPTSNAGSDNTVQLPTSSVTLIGSGSDVDGNISGYSWLQTSGPAATISSPSTSTTSISGLTASTYSFQLTVTDNAGATAKDQVQITVLPIPPPPPIYDTVKCVAVWYDKGSGSAPSRKNVTYFVRKPNGDFDNTNTKLNILFYIETDGTKRSISGAKL